MERGRATSTEPDKWMKDRECCTIYRRERKCGSIKLKKIKYLVGVGMMNANG